MQPLSILPPHYDEAEGQVYAETIDYGSGKDRDARKL